MPPTRSNRARRYSGHLPPEIYHEIMNAPLPELQEADRAMTQQVESWDGVPTLGHYTALEALVLIRLRLHGHTLTPAQPSLFDSQPNSPQGAPTAIPPPGASP